MLEHNEYDIFPGVYEHYKGGLYVVETIVNWHQPILGGAWEKLHDPLVVYRNLLTQYEKLNGEKEVPVTKNFCQPLSRFREMVDIGNSKQVPRFKLA